MTEQLPVWNAEGVEPTTELKKNGWQPGMKPSAQHMNWLFNRTYRILEELQNTKVDKINGKGLSTNDYTTAEKNKLADLTITAGQLRNDIGIMRELTTTNKSSLVNAVNEVKGSVDDLQIGGRNLLRNSKNSGNATPTQYEVDRFYLTEPLIEGQKYTLRMLLNTSVEKKAAAAYVRGGNSGNIAIKWFYNIQQGENIYTVTFTATAEMANITQSESSRYVVIYVSNNNGGQGSTPFTGTANVIWIKLEKGDKATDWTPAPEDVNDNLLNTALKLTSINLNIIDMAVELETLKCTTLNGVTANIFIETFQNLDDINLMNGVYDSANKRLVL